MKAQLRSESLLWDSMGKSGENPDFFIFIAELPHVLHRF
jgi:hypothetical protein